MGHVALPGLVGKSGLEADPARTRAFLGLSGDEAAAAQHPVDGGQRRRHRAGLAQMPRDGARAGVEAVFAQALAPADDLVLEQGLGEIGRHLGTPLVRHQSRLPALSVQGYVALHPGLRAPCRRRHGPHGAPLDEHGVDAVPGQIHETASERVSQNC
jgi:hypothetical protein